MECYVVLCDVWNGSTYTTDATCVCMTRELADRQVVAMQGKSNEADIRYYVQASEIEGPF